MLGVIVNEVYNIEAVKKFIFILVSNTFSCFGFILL